jgi:hypothetical protein
MAWLRKRAELVEVIVNDPGATKSGVCMECFQRNGKPASQVGRPPFHPHCACRVDTVEKQTQPGKVLDENFVGMQPAEFPLEEPEQGGVEEMIL